MFSVEGKRILITGSSRGIGLTLARGLAEAGAHVILNGTKAATLSLAEENLREEGYTVHSCLFDVTDETGIDTAVGKIEREIGPIEVLINNAGIQKRAPLKDFPYEDWIKLMDVNLSGVFLVSKRVVQSMLDRKRGKIINICSLQSELARPTIAPYAASKGGVKMLTRAMACEWAKENIQVNGIGPGYFITDMTKTLALDETFDTWIRGRTPAGRWGDPKELVGAAIFFSSPASDFVNGQILYVDGGLSSVV